MLPLLALALGLSFVPGPAPFAVTPPALVLEFDAGAVQGTPIQLAWSPDSERWYLETLEGDGPAAKHHRFEISVGERAPRALDAAPPWAASYWAYKSSRNVPGHPTILIAVDESRRKGTLVGTESGQQRARGVMSGTGGDSGTALRGAQDASVDYANAARVLTLTLDRTVISTLVDEPLVPGTTFGWSPTKYDAVAFRNEHHHGLSIFHLSGAVMNVEGTKEILLPAWSPDGSKIAFLEQVGKKKWALRQVTVSLP